MPTSMDTTTDWRSHWTVSLKSSTATHCDGWVFAFSQVPGADKRSFIIEFANLPSPFTTEHVTCLPDVLNEAALIYFEACSTRQ